jgi:hypothetical protein
MSIKNIIVLREFGAINHHNNAKYRRGKIHHFV